MAIRSDSAGLERKYLLDMLPAQGKRILEIGCGDGRLTWQYAERADAVVGIDVTDESLREGLAGRSARFARSVDFALASSTDLPFSSNSFHHALFAWSF